MRYVGIQTQIWRNNFRSLLLLLAFPILILSLVYIFFFIVYDGYSEEFSNIDSVNRNFLETIPVVMIIVAIWFTIAYFFNTSMIKAATSSKTLDRKEDKRVYNLVENLAIAEGMKMPKVNIIEDSSLNAFASGISKKTYTITLTRGIIDTLDDDELEGVIAHEFMHIKNKDVKLLIVTIVFVGIFAFLAQVAFRMFIYGGVGGGRKKKSDGRAMIVIFVLVLIGWLLSSMFKLALSRKREYMADFGAAQMTRNPKALASALDKISSGSKIRNFKNSSVSPLFIANPMKNIKRKKQYGSFFKNLFSTHPPIGKRIDLLEQV